jgi:hypothetical protein
MSTAVLVGDEILFSFSFQSLGTTDPADPDAVTVVHREPDGTETSYVYLTDSEVTRQSLGNYQFKIRVTDWKRHHFGAFGVGTVTKVVPTYIDVPESYFETLPS